MILDTLVFTEVMMLGQLGHYQIRLLEDHTQQHIQILLMETQVGRITKVFTIVQSSLLQQMRIRLLLED